MGQLGGGGDRGGRAGERDTSMKNDKNAISSEALQRFEAHLFFLRMPCPPRQKIKKLFKTNINILKIVCLKEESQKANPKKKALDNLHFSPSRRPP